MTKKMKSKESIGPTCQKEGLEWYNEVHLIELILLQFDGWYNYLKIE
jgi:hypothetical protein